MREEKPSQTASFVALARALADDGITSIPGFSDPVARRLLSRGWSVAYRVLGRALGSPRRRERAIARLDVIPLRVVAIDAEVQAALERGCRQLVILGAGLDSRAYRMAALRDVAVFEVDHPATQAWKRQKAPPPVARSLAFVPVDFEKDSLAERLRASGFRADEPTVWVWEGVVMYLTDAALESTLGDVGRLSAPGSALLVHYHEPYEVTGAREEHSLRLLLAFWREPQIGRRTPEVMHQAVRRAGFEVASDTRPSDWASRARSLVPTGLTAAVTHLLVAIRTA
jgi:methyltransferase (TIGR00027 family)